MTEKTLSRLRSGLIIFLCFTFLGLTNVPQIYLYFSKAPNRFIFWNSLARAFIGLYIWGALTHMIFWFGRRLPIEKPRLFRNLTLHLLLSIVFALTQTMGDVAIVALTKRGTDSAPFRMNLALLLNIMTNGIIFYAGILAVGQALNYFRKYREREFRLAQAELQVLRMQLHPHFLFNTLNAISELVYEDAEKADRSITQLSDLLRLSLKSGKAQEVTLKEELDFLSKYIEIQQTLMQERLSVEWKIDSGTLDARVPNMILQPLVENSIRHGLSRRASGGHIEIGAQRFDGMLHLHVRDDGAGLKKNNESANVDGGVGLSNMRARLKQLYGSRHRFELRETPGGGLTAELAIPFQDRAEKEKHEDSHANR